MFSHFLGFVKWGNQQYFSPNMCADKYYLRRFLRARHHDLRKAIDMFLAHLKWREDFGVDTILEDFHFHERDAFLTLYPQGYHKTDRLGRPIYIQHLGQINVKAIARVTTEERMLKFHVQEYERAMRYIFPACSLIAGRHVSQTLAIMDLKGVGLRHLSGEVKRILGTITRTDQDNYPETLGKTLIINAPTVFRAIWTIVKPMLDPRTQAKIEVCPQDYLKVLTKWVDPENIPSYLGGKSQASLLDDVGPWNDPGIIAELDNQRYRRDGASLEVVEDNDTRRNKENDNFVDDVVSPGSSEVQVASHLQGEGSTGFYDAPSVRRLSSLSTVESAYMSADEFVSRIESYSSEREDSIASPFRQTGATSGIRRPPAPPPPPLIIPSDTEATTLRPDFRGQATQSASILARIRALEESIGVVERPLRKQLRTAGESLPSETVGQGTLIHRISLLERAMQVLLTAQERAGSAVSTPAPHHLEPRRNARQSGGSCCRCCTVM